LAISVLKKKKKVLTFETLEKYC